eukprot:g21575.t1
MPSASAVALWSTALVTSEAVVDRFTTNAICRRNLASLAKIKMCDLEKLQAWTWTCPDPESKPSLEFCNGAVLHRVAEMRGFSGQDAVKKQEDMASTAYFYHLSGMKRDPWDFREPGKHEDGCVKAIWHMVCSTYLPKAPVHCKKGEKIPYLLPCRSESYLDACDVECCDESVQCNPEKGIAFAPPFNNFTGYSMHTAPSAECTGSGASRTAGPSLLILMLGLATSFVGHVPSFTRPKGVLLGALAVVAVSLQGCDIMFSHSAGTWETRPNYLQSFAVKKTEVEGSSGSAASPSSLHLISKSYMNSCSNSALDDGQKCNGRGVCKEFAAGQSWTFEKSVFHTAYPSASARLATLARSVEVTARFLGLDRFYLGELSAGTLKMATLGGFGVWWMWDIVWIGSAPIYTRGHGRLAADLPHFVYVILAVLWVAFLGYFIFGVVGAMWHESRMLNLALKKVEMIQNHLAKHRLISQSEERRFEFDTSEAQIILAILA